MHRRPAGRLVGQRTDGSAADPAVRPYLAEFEFVADAADRPALLDGLVEQGEQPGFGGRVDPPRDPATQPQRPFPSTSISLTAISVSASDSRLTSALASSIS